MITTVCMNPSFDKTASIESLKAGEVNRLSDVRCDVGGKGLNVAIVLKRLGVAVNCVGCVGENNEREFLEMVKQQGILFQTLRLPGSIRTNLKILDRNNRQVTEFNEAGLEMNRAEQTRFFQLLQEHANHSEYVVFSGRLPIGCQPDTYREGMRALLGKRCVLDATGETLRAGLAEAPYLIKPNLPEAEALLKRELKTLRSIRDAALELVGQGAQHVIISMGKFGAVYSDGHRSLFAPAVAVEACSTVGAGDALIGGVLFGLSRGEPVEEALRRGVAAGCASVMTDGTQLLTVKDFETILPKVTLQEL